MSAGWPDTLLILVLLPGFCCFFLMNKSMVWRRNNSAESEPLALKPISDSLNEISFTDTYT